MNCIKTGCSAYIQEYGEWVYGDAYEFNGALIIRVCQRTRNPYDNRHFTVARVDHWFDEDKSSMAHNSTLFAHAGAWVGHGYDGMPEPRKVEVKA